MEYRNCRQSLWLACAVPAVLQGRSTPLLQRMFLCCPVQFASALIHAQWRICMCLHLKLTTADWGEVWGQGRRSDMGYEQTMVRVLPMRKFALSFEWMSIRNQSILGAHLQEGGKPLALVPTPFSVPQHLAYCQNATSKIWCWSLQPPDQWSRAAQAPQSTLRMLNKSLYITTITYLQQHRFSFRTKGFAYYT